MKISVIVPVYNCEKFIEEFIDCLQKQTISDYEAIFIDDCSTDKTSQILMQAISEDSRLHYYRNETRRGAAYSRNRGIDNSHAPYILCLDADDRFEPDILEQVCEAAYSNDADMVMLNRGDFYGFDLNTIERNRYLFEDEKIFLQQSVFSVKEQPLNFLIRCENGTCDRAIRKSLLDRYHIRFQDLKNSNDVFYIIFSTFVAAKIIHTKTYDNLYHRRIHSEPGRISNDRNPMCAYQALQKVHDNLIVYDLWDDYCCYFWIFALDSLERQLFCCKNIDKQKEVYQFLQAKGLYSLGIETDKNYEMLSKEFRHQYSKLLKLDFNEKCFLKSMSFEAFCDINMNKLKELAEEMTFLRVAIWGAGRLATVFAQKYSKQGGSIRCIIDNDVQKQGKRIEDIEIVAFDDIWNNIDTIIISNRHYYGTISRQVKEKSNAIKLLSMEEIVFG